MAKKRKIDKLMKEADALLKETYAFRSKNWKNPKLTKYSTYSNKKSRKKINIIKKIKNNIVNSITIKSNNFKKSVKSKPLPLPKISKIKKDTKRKTKKFNFSDKKLGEILDHFFEDPNHVADFKATLLIIIAIIIAIIIWVGIFNLK